MSSKSKTLAKTYRIRRDPKTGQFNTVQARKKPTTTIVKHAAKPEYGDTGKNNNSKQYIEEAHKVSGKSIDTISKTSRKRSRTLKNLAKR